MPTPWGLNRSRVIRLISATPPAFSHRTSLEIQILLFQRRLLLENNFSLQFKFRQDWNDQMILEHQHAVGNGRCLQSQKASDHKACRICELYEFVNRRSKMIEDSEGAHDVEEHPEAPEVNPPGVFDASLLRFFKRIRWNIKRHGRTRRTRHIGPSTPGMCTKYFTALARFCPFFQVKNRVKHGETLFFVS